LYFCILYCSSQWWEWEEKERLCVVHRKTQRVHCLSDFDAWRCRWKKTVKTNKIKIKRNLSSLRRRMWRGLCKCKQKVWSLLLMFISASFRIWVSLRLNKSRFLYSKFLCFHFSPIDALWDFFLLFVPKMFSGFGVHSKQCLEVLFQRFFFYYYYNQIPFMCFFGLLD